MHQASVSWRCAQESARAHVLAIATEYRQEAVILQRSARLLGYRFQLCGFRERWVGWGTKLIQYRKALQKDLASGRMAATDPVLLIDGWDCMLIGPATEFVEKMSLPPFSDGHQPWYAGERICGPDFFKANRIDAVYPDPGTPWRYPNAGCMAGRAEPVLELINALLQSSGDGDSFPEDGDDQGRLHEHLLERGESGQSLPYFVDSECRIFQCLYEAEPQWRLEPAQEGQLFPRLCNTQTHQQPIVLHGNGHTGRWFMSCLWREMELLPKVGLTIQELSHLPHDGPVPPGTVPDEVRVYPDAFEFRMTNTELKLKRERMMDAFRAGKAALEDLRLPYFLAYGSALSALREGQFQPYEDDIHVGIYSWDLAALQRQCTECTAKERDSLLKSTFDRFGFEPVQEIVDNPLQASSGNNVQQNQAVLVCPRYYIAEGWSDDMAFPILYKFTHRDSFVRFDLMVFTMQFGQLWDFADGGAETSSGWRYSLFAPQPVEFEKIMTFTMPAKPLEDHYGEDWHVPRVYNYVQSLACCKNRCQVLRVHPFDARMRRVELPPAQPWEEFKSSVRQFRILYAKAMADSEHEFPEQKLDLYKLESKPVVLFQAASLCKEEGNARLKEGKHSGALDKYDEGIYIIDKCREVLLTWRLIFRQIHNEKADKDRKDRGLKVADLVEPDMPREFRSDEDEERSSRLALLLNAAQAALQCQKWSVVEARASAAMELEPHNKKALYRRGLARASSGDTEGAKADFWALLKVSSFDSKEAINQLSKLLPKDAIKAGFQKLRKEAEKEQKVGALLKELDEDERIAIQDERYERYLGDCEQRAADGQREITFDEWAKQYEWRYDAEERFKARQAHPECFNHTGPAPLPVEDWEVDYLTHKEIEKIVYRRQTETLAARRRQREKEANLPEKKPLLEDASGTKLYLDKEDEQILRDAVVKNTRELHATSMIALPVAQSFHYQDFATERNWMATFQLYRIIEQQMAYARVGIEWDPWKIAAEQKAEHWREYICSGLVTPQAAAEVFLVLGIRCSHTAAMCFSLSRVYGCNSFSVATSSDTLDRQREPEGSQMLRNHEQLMLVLAELLSWPLSAIPVVRQGMFAWWSCQNMSMAVAPFTLPESSSGPSPATQINQWAHMEEVLQDPEFAVPLGEDNHLAAIAPTPTPEGLLLGIRQEVRQNRIDTNRLEERKMDQLLQLACIMECRLEWMERTILSRRF
ncbi:PLOD1 [Symbiodinium pilosum]|uniref:PLOD1 protein n=1 Tax=Symbiodinium pilosum TaxID=2952 RepID=A0A812KK86_SYMPI|nr:PLOD1 [Symbiodinium pilosum]